MEYWAFELCIPAGIPCHAIDARYRPARCGAHVLFDTGYGCHFANGKGPGSVSQISSVPPDVWPDHPQRPATTLLDLDLWKHDRSGAMYRVRRLGSIFAGNPEPYDSLVVNGQESPVPGENQIPPSSLASLLHCQVCSDIFPSRD